MGALAIRENVTLAPFTTFGVGGPARFFAEAHTEEDVAEAVHFSQISGVPLFVLGGGSNLLVADRGVGALVLRLRLRGIRVEPAGDMVHVAAAAGEPWDGVVATAVREGWAGIECLSGIPGEVGATPIQNVGAYGQEVSDTIVRVNGIDARSGQPVTFSPEMCAFSYRDSAFKKALAGRYVLTEVTYALRPGGAPRVRYAELQRALENGQDAEDATSLGRVRETVLRLRRSKSMVLDETDENRRSAGSFFTNPIVEGATLARAREAARTLLAAGETMPEFPAAAGRTKLAAGWLIERAGFSKGRHEGPVGISTRHALAIVNRGGASAAQIAAFARKVQDAVQATFGVKLTPEPVWVGFEGGA